MERQNTEVARTSKGILLILILLFCLFVGIFIYFIASSKYCFSCDTSTVFGNDCVNGTYHPDAIALTTGGERVGEGIETKADPPTIVFEDDFEGTSPWTANDDVDEDSPVHYWGTKGAYFDPTVDDRASLNATFSTAVAVAADETIEIYFYVNASVDWDVGDDDYFILRFSFTGGKHIAYVIMGDYSPANSSEAVISVTTQVTALGLWAGVNIQKIDDDYVAQFGASCPSIAKISFVLDSNDFPNIEDVTIDELQLVKLPKEFAGGSYWKKVPSGEHVTSYFVEATYEIDVSAEIDSTNTHAEIKLWIEIYDSSTMTTELLSKTLVQDEILAYITTDTVLTWTSKVFALPKDDTVLGGHLYYSFSIQIEAWGEIIAEPGHFIRAVGIADDFDALEFEWTAVTGSIDVIIYAISAGAIGGGGMVFIGARKRRSGKQLGIDEKESLFN
jgi:hypothetical protein